MPLLRKQAQSSDVALSDEGIIRTLAQISVLCGVEDYLSRLVYGAACLGPSWEGDCKALTDFCTPFVSNEDRDKGTEMFHVQSV